MKCPKCKLQDLRISHTYNAGESARTHRAVCDDCGAVAVIVSEIYLVDPSHGNGAAALAHNWKNGHARKKITPGL